MIFIAQVEGISFFKINREIDPKFYESLEEARENGVELLAYSCWFKDFEVRLGKRIEITS